MQKKLDESQELLDEVVDCPEGQTRHGKDCYGEDDTINIADRIIDEEDDLKDKGTSFQEEW